ncbi:hypothetical protein AUJ42_02175 [Candidatus Collierbacteria bacterium CG1_02_44_10]|uniref:Uncharacterized protein n=4 Tax=Candidatus Collieribacteriota TaxID=1752725 RepID=A0A2H0DV86_9BACT|nr:hypothetical protein [bacterium]OIN91119.1 MAG: hypothetical protein AUJ42_02175 [Candidatus Collierbacteria bacterium CG1_02_44_10]PIP85500.1 MAG: hypothetical protein COW83_03980 [Candidatus Collierbacteria bacterium CG22_combo_CG10-13_8_21_14_all_43_12]PIR99719.1 MAG: hypothetical protein COT86_02405 [Candidatus Collierbacteria bacterium CG10_big_fil_rev_8_21_14_0_10_43_36]PIZ24677.1 MAG: hypothetical protein COY48_01545 [Candidatus Collierbacteria bacterium CG_4_10_14_0_8_um_filter_43_86
MPKTTDSTTYITKVIILATLALIVGYLLTSGKSPKINQTDTDPAIDSIQEESGLNQAQDELEAINIDSVDSGINQLNTESGSF